MSRLFVRVWLFNKRLLKKPSFICILAFSILFVFVFSLTASSGEAMLTVATASEEPGDALYQKVLSSLNNGSLIEINEMSVSEAEKAVENGKADAAWIFPRGLEEKIKKYVNDVNEDNFVITVIQREESVLMQLSREKLMSALYPHLSISLYSEFIDLRYPQLTDIKSDDLEELYESTEAEGEEMFRIVTPQGISVTTERGVLLSPLRGMLAVLAVISGLSVSLYSMRDEREGCFDMIPKIKRFGVYTVYNSVAVINVALVSLAALAVSGLAVSLSRELLLLLAFILSAVAFSTFFRVVFTKESLFSVFIPFVALILLTLCPVFVNIQIPLWLRLLLPPYGYIAGLYSDSLMLVWCCSSCLLYLASYLVFKLRMSIRK